jgi:alpha-glucosidase
VPIPWEAERPAYGFSPVQHSWLPQPADWGPYARDSQAGVDGSTLELYRSLLSTRAANELGLGEIEWLDGYPDDVVAFRNGAVTVIANTGEAVVPLPAGTVMLSSEPLGAGVLPGDTTVWLSC